MLVSNLISKLFSVSFQETVSMQVSTVYFVLKNVMLVVKGFEAFETFCKCRVVLEVIEIIPRLSYLFESNFYSEKHVYSGNI